MSNEIVSMFRHPNTIYTLWGMMTQVLGDLRARAAKTVESLNR